MMHDDSFDDFNDLELADEIDFLRASHRNLDAHLSDRVFAISETDDIHQSVSEGFQEVLDEETSLNKNPAASARLGAMAKAKPQSASSSGQNDSLLSGNFNCDIVVAHALNSLEPDRVEHFWEKGFWSNVFTDGIQLTRCSQRGLRDPCLSSNLQWMDCRRTLLTLCASPSLFLEVVIIHQSSAVVCNLHGGTRGKRSGKQQFADGTRLSCRGLLMQC